MNPQDRPKAVLLLVAVLAVFGFAFWRLTSMRAANTPAPARASAPTQAPPSAVASNTPGGAPQMLTDEELAQLDASAQDTDVPAPVFDPFRKTVRLQTGSDTPATVATASQPGAIQGVAPLGVTPPADDPMSMATFELVGVVIGKPALAVMRAGDQMLYLKKGERISKEIVLFDVRNEYVVLRYRKNNFKVAIGEPRQLVEGSIGLTPTGEAPVAPLPDVRQPTSLPAG